MLIFILSRDACPHGCRMNSSVFCNSSFLESSTWSSPLQLIAFLSFPTHFVLNWRLSLSLCSWISLHCAARFHIHFPAELASAQWETSRSLFVLPAQACWHLISQCGWEMASIFPAIVNEDYIQEKYIICHLWFILSSHTGDLVVISAAQCNYSKASRLFLL